MERASRLADKILRRGASASLQACEPTKLDRILYHVNTPTCMFSLPLVSQVKEQYLGVARPPAAAQDRHDCRTDTMKLERDYQREWAGT